ncbi:MAG TPA: YIP1 family protein [Anaerolineaceae bacterium]|jgi:hypothetical protein
MMTTELDILPIQRPRRLRLDWLGPLFWRPKQTLEKVQQEPYGTWLAPLLALTILAVIAVLIGGPLRQAAAAAAPQTLPQNFQYWSPEQQSQYTQSLATAVGPTIIYVLPAAGELLKIWLGWFLFAAILHLALTLAGSRGNMTSALNLVAWSSLPVAVRYLVQIGSMLFAQQLVAHPGLSGFAPQASGAVVRYLGAVLPFLDLYLVWGVILMIIGLVPSAGISTRKILVGVLISLAILLLLEALPGFISTQLGSLGGTGGYNVGGVG